MNNDTYEASQAQPPVLPTSAGGLPTAAIQCPSCGSTQFFGGRKTSGWGWFWLISSILNLIISIPLMFVFIGFITALLSPLMGIGFYVCKRHVNTCARCKRDF